MRKAGIILLLIVLSFSQASCYDANEIDDLLHVVGMGIDLGITDKWRLTLQYSTMKASGSGGDTAQPPSGGPGSYTCAAIEAPSFFAAVNMLNTSLPRRINFTHTQFIVFSEELARSGLVGEYIAPIKRSREIRDSAHVLVVKGGAEEFLRQNQPVVGSVLSMSFETQVAESYRTGFFPHVILEQFYAGLKSPYYQPIATLAALNDLRSFPKKGEKGGEGFKTGGGFIAGGIPRTGENKVELFGTAVFDGDKMAGELNGDETRYMLMARGDFKQGFFTMRDPTNPELIIPLDVTAATGPQVKIAFSGDQPIIHLKIDLNADILAVQSPTDYRRPEQKKALENSFRRVIQEGTEKVIAKCQGLGTDVFMFGDHATKKFLTIGDLERYNWNQRFKDAEVEVEVEIVIRRTGNQIGNYPIHDTEGTDT